MDLKARPNSRLWSNAESRANDAADQYARDFWKGLPEHSKRAMHDALVKDLQRDITLEAAFLGDYIDQWPSATLQDAFGSFFANRVEKRLITDIFAFSFVP